ncbi:MAG: sigma-70 family RNA polymerase sigma factor [Gemmataceae bacterium]|nr:sigma-70 family RNA polymerase sigma factor [Gemmataceae bacterium]
MPHGQLGAVIRFLRRATAAEAGAITDRQLLERFTRQKDEDAFTSLVERHGPMVLAVCRRVLGSAHAAEDCFQAAFLVLAQKADALHWDESVGSWLHEVAYRVSQKARVDAARRRAHERQVSDVPVANSAAPDVDLRELRTMLDEELTRLPEKFRAPLVLCYLEGKTNEEAAQLLGWTKGSVSGQLARARDLLRQRLSRRGVALALPLFATILTENAAPASVPAALLSSTVKAAVLGPVAKAASAGAVTAPVAALAEGVLKAMVVTKWKMAAMILLVVGVLGTGAGLATYYSQASGKDDPQLAFVPVPPLDEPKTVAQPKASEPVVKDGLSLTVKPDKAVFGLNEPLGFVQSLKNTTDKSMLFNEFFSRTPTTSIRIEEVRTGDVWQFVDCSGLPLPPAPQPTYVLAPGATFQMPALFKNNDRNQYRYIKVGTERNLKAGVEHLPPGKYLVSSRLGWGAHQLPAVYHDLTANQRVKNEDLKKPTQWSGEIVSKTSPFEIAATPALGTSAPVEKDGLAVAITPAKEIFGPQDTLEFTVRYKNVSKAAYLLSAAKMDGFYQFEIEGVDPKSGPWAPVYLANASREMEAGDSIPLEPAAELAVTVRLGGWPFRHLGPQDGKRPLLDRLPRGKYQVRAVLNFRMNPVNAKFNHPHWIGEIKSKTASFEIGDPIALTKDRAIELAQVEAEKALVVKYAQWSKEVRGKGDTPPTRNEPWLSKTKPEVIEQAGGWTISWTRFAPAGWQYQATAEVDMVGKVKIVSTTAHFASE